MEIHEQIIQLKTQLKVLILKDWLTQDVFSLRWWFLFASLVIGYAVWLKFLDKRRTIEIVLYGALIVVLNVSFDIFAVLYGLWTYKVRFFPIMPSVFPYDYSFIPVIYMLVYQYFTPWKKFFWGGAIASALFSFAYFPILKYWGIVQLHHWNFVYSFILGYADAIIARAAIGWMQDIQMRATEKTS